MRVAPGWRLLLLDSMDGVARDEDGHGHIGAEQLAWLVAQLDEDREMIRELTPPLDPAKLASGEQTAVFFGSAMSDVGVQPFLEHFIALSAPPAPRVRLTRWAAVAARLCLRAVPLT